MLRVRTVGVVVCLVVGGLAASSPAEQERHEGIVRGGGRLGVVIVDVGKDDLGRLKLSEERGVIVKEVRKDTPADRAGLKPGDVILRYQGETVMSAAQFTRLIRETPADRTVALEISRDGTPQRLSATLEAARDEGFFEGMLPELHVPVPPMPPGVPDAEGIRGLVLRNLDGLRFGLPRRLGIEYESISGQFARYFKAPADRAILVTSVDEDGAAAKAGVKAGDLILKVDGQEVREASDLRRAVMRADAGQELTLTLQREGRTLEVKVKLEEAERPRRERKTTT